MDETDADEAPAATKVGLRFRLRSKGRAGGSGTGALDRWLERIGSGGVGSASPDSAGAALESTGGAAIRTGSGGGGGGSDALATWTGGGSG